jgi:hypothetical protein
VVFGAGPSESSRWSCAAARSGAPSRRYRVRVDPAEEPLAPHDLTGVAAMAGHPGRRVAGHPRHRDRRSRPRRDRIAGGRWSVGSGCGVGCCGGAADSLVALGDDALEDRVDLVGESEGLRRGPTGRDLRDLLGPVSRVARFIRIDRARSAATHHRPARECPMTGVPTSMRAAVLDAPGPPEALRIREVPAPVPEYGQVLIKVEAFGLNRSELHTRLGLAKGVTFPRVLGIAATGVVAACPGGELAPGSKVAALMGGMGRTFDGGYAEYTRVPVRQTVPFTSDLSIGPRSGPYPRCSRPRTVRSPSASTPNPASRS